MEEVWDNTNAVEDIQSWAKENESHLEKMHPVAWERYRPSP